MVGPLVIPPVEILTVGGTMEVHGVCLLSMNPLTFGWKPVCVISKLVLVHTAPLSLTRPAPRW